MTRIQTTPRQPMPQGANQAQANDPSAGSTQRHQDGFDGLRRPETALAQGTPEPMVWGSGRVPGVPASVHAQMVELSDPSTLKDMYDLRRRVPRCLKKYRKARSYRS